MNLKEQKAQEYVDGKNRYHYDGLDVAEVYITGYEEAIKFANISLTEILCSKNFMEITNQGLLDEFQENLGITT